ncbi:alcohol dehydrogenase catalytic domain-containing protein [Candidatus Bathyarchaeota archaeon]|nr:alcohol dehydrogenase catalytic domain-containing protein [Candidatus Bathyarchaeota archaeon]
MVGDRVAVEPGVPCENCFLCREGRYNLCEDVQFAGVYPYHGTAQRYKVHPAKWLYKCVSSLSSPASSPSLTTSPEFLTTSPLKKPPSLSP